MEESIHFDLCSSGEVHNGKEGLAVGSWNRKLRNHVLLQRKLREITGSGMRIQTLSLAPSDALPPTGQTCKCPITFPSSITKFANA